MALEVGQVVSDYEILALLGRGGMGSVYRVRHIISNRVEAMKVLLADLAGEAELGDRFIGEIRTLARLDHPNIAKFHTAFKVENQLAMVMEFVEGFTLSERAKQGPIPLDQVLSYATQTLAALAYAHEAGVIHRDIKPANIMITPHGVAKLMDFGIAKSSLDPLLTRPGTTMGSMLYMSPEQVRGTSVDGRSDIYSVGVLLYELSAGRRPFEAENTFAILEAQLNTQPKAPIELNPALPGALNEIILTAMDKEPMRRFQSAEAFRKALESVRLRPALERTQVETVAYPQLQGAGQGVQAQGAAGKRGNRGLWMAVGAVACVGVLVGGAVMLPHFSKSSADSKAAAMTDRSTASAQSTPAAAPAPAQSTPAPAPAQSTPAPGPAVDTAAVVGASAQPQPVQTQALEPRRPGKIVSPPGPRINSDTVQKQPEQVAAQQSQAMPVPATSGQAAAAAAGPSQEQLDQADEELMKLRTRADAIRGSLEHLRSDQAASGLSINPTIAGSASRMENYLQAAQRALQSNSLDAARKNMDRADGEIGKLEAFFGR